jgi:hypothetical protein
VDAVITVDLDSVACFKEIAVGTLYDPKSWILHPASIACEVSTDGSSFVPLTTETITGDQRNEEVTKTCTFTNNSGRGRYIRFIITGTHTLPYWHPSAGGHSWFFVDEIVIE